MGRFFAIKLSQQSFQGGFDMLKKKKSRKKGLPLALRRIAKKRKHDSFERLMIDDLEQPKGLGTAPNTGPGTAPNTGPGTGPNTGPGTM